MLKKLMSVLCVFSLSTQALAVGTSSRSLASVLSACESVECQYEAIWRYSSHVDANGINAEQLEQDAQALGSIADKADFLAYGLANGFIKKNQYDFAVANINKATDEQSAVAIAQGFEAVGGTGAALNPSAKRALSEGSCVAGVAGLFAMVVVASSWYLLPFFGTGLFCGFKVFKK